MSLLILIIGIPLLEIFLFIKIGSVIGAFNTIALILITAITGIIYARHQSFNALRSGFAQLVKNEVPIYEIISGATLAFAALLLIIPGFLTDLVGFLLIIPITRKFFIRSVFSKFNRKKNDGNIIEGSFEEDKQDNNNKKNHLDEL